MREFKRARGDSCPLFLLEQPPKIPKKFQLNTFSRSLDIDVLSFEKPPAYSVL